MPTKNQVKTTIPHGKPDESSNQSGLLLTNALGEPVVIGIKSGNAGDTLHGQDDSKTQAEFEAYHQKRAEEYKNSIKSSSSSSSSSSSFFPAVINTSSLKPSNSSSEPASLQ